MKKILTLVVKISYPFESLTKEEQDALHGATTHFLHFYDDRPDYDERMAKMWRPGARAEHYGISSTFEGTKIAVKTKGVWE